MAISRKSRQADVIARPRVQVSFVNADGTFTNIVSASKRFADAMTATPDADRDATKELCVKAFLADCKAALDAKARVRVSAEWSALREDHQQIARETLESVLSLLVPMGFRQIGAKELTDAFAAPSYSEREWDRGVAPVNAVSVGSVPSVGLRF